MTTDPSFMNLVSAHMTALQCPPLPVLVHGREPSRAAAAAVAAAMVSDDDDDPPIASSFDLLSNHLFVAMERDNPAANAVRMRRQRELTDELMRALLRRHTPDDSDSAYDAFRAFKAGYIGAYLPGISGCGVDFAPIDDATPALKKECASWNAARDILLAVKAPRNREQYAALSYRQQIAAAALRERTGAPHVMVFPCDD